jgi:hypothetical protein
MRVITSNQGIAARRADPDEIAPKTTAQSSQDMMAAIKARYSFSLSMPNVGGTAFPQPMIFHSGKFTHDGISHVITQLVMEYVGDVAASDSTDVADAFLDDLYIFIDEKFEFRTRSAQYSPSYLSVIVAEFSARFEGKISDLGRIAQLFNGLARNKDANIYRLEWGYEKTKPFPPNVVTLQPQSQTETVEQSQFVLERRAGVSFNINRWYCSAPLKTNDHLRLLEQIESLLA